MTPLAEAIRKHLTADLLKPEYQGSTNPLAGHCYVASEAYYHLAGRNAGYSAYVIKHEGASHWYLWNGLNVIDLTAEQFNTPVPYSQGRRIGFLTKQPSKRAQILIDRVLNGAR